MIYWTIERFNEWMAEWINNWTNDLLIERMTEWTNVCMYVYYRYYVIYLIYYPIAKLSQSWSGGNSKMP